VRLNVAVEGTCHNSYTNSSSYVPQLSYDTLRYGCSDDGLVLEGHLFDKRATYLHLSSQPDKG
jgi:hypothetical protein